MSRLGEQLRPRVLPVRDYLGSNVFVNAVIQLLVGAGIAGLAVSRANGHRLPPTAMAVMLAVGALFGVCFASVGSFFTGLADTVGGLVSRDDRDVGRDAARDPLSTRSIWGRALGAALVAGLWGAGLGVLIVAVLNRRQAGFGVVFVGWLVAVALATVVASLAMGAEGVRTGFRRAPSMTPRPARRRAWREIALPIAILLGISSGSFTWILFHDYAVGVQFGSRVLTEQQVLADLPVLLAIHIFLAMYFCGRAGRAEAAMGLVTFEDADTQVPDAKSGYGVQAIVGAIVAVVLVTSLVRFLLPSLPNLAEAIIARGFLAGAITLLVGGLSYIRGAANVTAGAAPVVRLPAGVTQ